MKGENMESINLYDKYEIISNNQPFELKLLKDNKEIRDLTGDDLIHIMFLRIKELERKEEVCKKQHIAVLSNRYKNVNEVSACGVGYIGEGKYRTYSNNQKSKRSPQYVKWMSMLVRCYDPKRKLETPAYMECTVCDEWLNFQNFAKWYDENIYEFDGELIHLDKDILIKNNRIYSSETCLLVPESINRLIRRGRINKGILPIGVSLEGNKYKSACRYNNKQKYLGLFDTPEEAFKAYKKYKENLIK